MATRITGRFHRSARVGLFRAYDSIPCEQQKCLVHLIRDMNHDLLCSPYDQEFKSLVSRFEVLLRRIVDTIDRYGLNRYHLRKHEANVDGSIWS